MLLGQYSGADPRHLCIEVSESVLMASSRSTVDAFERLREKGIALALDDFGTSYSSLTYLRQSPRHVIKIDRAFTSGLATERDTAMSTRSRTSHGR